jgi:hypothetical protein
MSYIQVVRLKFYESFLSSPYLLKFSDCDDDDDDDDDDNYDIPHDNYFGIEDSSLSTEL